MCEDNYCGNCAHFDAKHPVIQIEGINVCRCLSKYSSLEPEVGSRIYIVLVSEFCNCTITDGRSILVGTKTTKGLLEHAAHMIQRGDFFGNARSQLCNPKYCPMYTQCTWRR